MQRSKPRDFCVISFPIDDLDGESIKGSSQLRSENSMANTAPLPEDFLMQALTRRLAEDDRGEDAPFELLDGVNLAIVPSSVAPAAGLLNAARRYSAHQFFHATGLGPACRDPDVFLWRLLAYLRDEFEIPESAPLDPPAMRETLPNWLARAAAMGGIAVVIEGAQNLSRDGLVADFDWLPDWLPPGVAVLISAPRGPASEQFRERSAGVFPWPNETGTVSEGGLPAGLLESERSCRVLELLWASRAGLERKALEAITGSLPSASDLETPAVLVRDGHLAIASVNARDEVARRRLGDHGRRQMLHVELAEHFDADTQPGSLLLACWHWTAAGRKDRLEQALTRPQLLESAFQPACAFETLRYWQNLGGSDRMREQLGAVCSEPGQRAVVVLGAARLIRLLTGQGADIVWLERALELAETERDPQILAQALRELAVHQETEASRARKLLDRAVEILEAAPHDEADLRAALHHQLACLAETARAPEEAAGQYERGLEIVKAAHGTETPRLIAWLNNLAAAHKATGDLRSADRHSRRALALARARLGSRHPTTASCCDQLAGIAYLNGQHEVAEPLFREVLEIAESAFGPRHPATAAGLGNLGSVLDARRKFEEAERCHRRSLSILMGTHGQTHEDTAVCMHNLAVTLESVGKLDDAEEFYRRALETWNEVAGESSPAFATTLLHLAGVLRERGEWGQAEALYRSDIELWRQLVGPEHPHTLGALTELARLYLEGGKPEMAEPLLLHLKDVTAQHQGKQSNTYLEVIALLARVYQELGFADEGRALIEDALDAGRGTLNMLSAPVQKLRKLLGDAGDTNDRNGSSDA